MRWGELLLRKKWPVLLAIFLGLALHVADFFGVFCNIVEFTGQWLQRGYRKSKGYEIP